MQTYLYKYFDILLKEFTACINVGLWENIIWYNVIISTMYASRLTTQKCDIIVSFNEEKPLYIMFV